MMTIQTEAFSWLVADYACRYSNQRISLGSELVK